MCGVVYVYLSSEYWKILQFSFSPASTLLVALLIPKAKADSCVKISKHVATVSISVERPFLHSVDFRLTT